MARNKELLPLHTLGNPFNDSVAVSTARHPLDTLIPGNLMEALRPSRINSCFSPTPRIPCLSFRWQLRWKHSYKGRLKVGRSKRARSPICGTSDSTINSSRSHRGCLCIGGAFPRPASRPGKALPPPAPRRPGPCRSWGRRLPVCQSWSAADRRPRRRPRACRARRPVARRPRRR